jgi:hypothetical protein
MHQRVATGRQLEKYVQDLRPEMHRPDGDPFKAPIKRFRTTKTKNGHRWTLKMIWLFMPPDLYRRDLRYRRQQK